MLRWVFVWAALIVGQSFAQAVPLRSGPGAAAYHPLFQRVLAEPANVELNLAFARAAIDSGDFEAAIATLERLLIGRTGLPLIRLELGMLYFRLGAPQRAAAYLSQAIADPNIPAEGLRRATMLLSSSRQQSQRGKLSGSLTVSGKYQSNANSGPDSEDFRIGFAARYPTINPATLAIPEETISQEDISRASILTLNYRYELVGLRHRTLDAALNIYSSRQDERQDLNILFGALRFGLTTRLSENFSLSPYASIANLSIGDYENYAATYTAGVSFNMAQGTALLLELAQSRHTNFTTPPTPDGNPLPNNSDRDGTRMKAALRWGYRLPWRMFLGMELRHAQDKAQQPIHQTSTNGLNLALNWGMRRPIRLSYKLAFDYARRAETVRQVETMPIRADTDMTLSLAVSGRLSRRMSMSFGTSNTQRVSNFPDAQYENTAVTLGFTRSF